MKISCIFIDPNQASRKIKIKTISEKILPKNRQKKPSIYKKYWA
jgi:hypothetical protein